MTLTLQADPVPLRIDEGGVVRVANTRVTLETLVAAFHTGATPEQLAYDFPSIALGDIYAVVGYYLKHRAEVDAYVARATEEARRTQSEIERQFDPHGIRERLLARQANGQGEDAASPRG